jgi:hypothetical protein
VLFLDDFAADSLETIERVAFDLPALTAKMKPSNTSPSIYWL